MKRTNITYNILIHTLDENIIEDGSQNVHDKNVRDMGTEKYLYLFSKMEEKYKKTGQDWLIKLQGYALYEFKLYDKYKMLYNKLLERELFLFHTPTGIKNVTELEVFALVWFGFKDLNKEALLTQLSDCYEDGNLICLNGRIARYLSSFVGITEDILGKSEITEKILFEEALREIKILLESFLKKSPELKKVYDQGGSEEEEEKLDSELFKIKRKFKREIEKKFPQLSEKKIDELMTAF